MKPFTLSRKRDALYKQRGMSLVEIMIVIAIASIVLALTLRNAGRASDGVNSNDEIGELTVVITKIQQMYSNRASFAGATQEVLVNGGSFLKSRVVPGTTDLVNRWGGEISVATVTVGGGAANNGIALTYQSVPSAECSAIIPKIDENVRVVTVNGTIVKQDGQPADLAAVGTACQENKMNEIVYQFSK